MGNKSGPWDKWIPGVLSKNQIGRLREDGRLLGLDEANCEDASSFDVSLSDVAFEMTKGGVKPAPGKDYLHSIRDLSRPIRPKNGLFVLKPNCTHVFKLREELHLAGAQFYGQATAKSSVGRMDVLARLIVNGMGEYEKFNPGALKNGRGQLYLEITPMTFPVLVKKGCKLSQLRLFYGDPSQVEVRSKELCRTVLGRRKSADLSVSLKPVRLGKEEGVAFMASRDANVEAVPLWPSNPDMRPDPRKYFQLTGPSDRRRLCVTKGEFYILRSVEEISVPPGIAVYCRAIDESIGEMRIHYAGFVHPGFGFERDDGAPGTPLIFEVRGHDVDANIRHGEKLANLIFYRMSEDCRGSSAYDKQTLKLSKFFADWSQEAYRSVMDQQALFSKRLDFRVLKLQASDVEFQSPPIAELATLLSAKRDDYPNIHAWYREKVLPGIGRERIAYIGYESEKPVVSAIVKLGRRAKFCHLRIKDDFQDAHLGEIFFALMAMDCRHAGASEIRFTLPEGLWASRSDFFSSFGFQHAERSFKQYRSKEDELVCQAPYERVWRSVVSKLPKLRNAFSIAGYSLAADLVVSIRPSHAEAIFSGRKSVEVRRNFPSKWKGNRLGIYATKPLAQLMGEATIADVQQSDPADIWERFGDRIGATREEFSSYTEGADCVSALLLDHVCAYSYPIPLAQVQTLLDAPLRPPQSYCTSKNEPWANAVSVAALLHGTFRPIPIAP